MCQDFMYVVNAVRSWSVLHVALLQMVWLNYPPNRPVTVHDGSFIILPSNSFAVVWFAVLAVTLRGPPVPDTDPLEMYYDSTSDSGHE